MTATLRCEAFDRPMATQYGEALEAAILLLVARRDYVNALRLMSLLERVKAGAV